jgi:glyoxylase-like metal-dependent hydrolase (beta-lactamase superfamily II)
VVIPEAKTVFVGDTLVLNQPPFLAQADFNAWSESLNSLLKVYSGFQIVCGRGGLAAIEDIRAHQKLIKDIAEGIEKLAARNAAPEATQEMVPKLLSKFSASGKQRDLYATRLRYGLYQCFVRRFFPTTVIGQPELEEEEQ